MDLTIALFLSPDYFLIIMIIVLFVILIYKINNGALERHERDATIDEIQQIRKERLDDYYRNLR